MWEEDVDLLLFWNNTRCLVSVRVTFLNNIHYWCTLYTKINTRVLWNINRKEILRERTIISPFGISHPLLRRHSTTTSVFLTFQNFPFFIPFRWLTQHWRGTGIKHGSFFHHSAIGLCGSINTVYTNGWVMPPSLQISHFLNALVPRP